MSQEAPKRSVEELLASGPPTEWYVGYGRVRDILGIWQSEIFDALANGQVERNFGEWSHIGAALHLGVVSRVPPRIQRVLNRTSAAVTKLTGFTPEEIIQKRHDLLKVFGGKEEAPFKLYLVEPFSREIPQPPLEYYIAYARRDEGIIRVHYSSALENMDNGRVREQLHNWTHYYGNYINDPNNDVRRFAMEIIEQAAYYLKATTGYFPQDLAARRDGLLDLYKGQEYAPFETEYVDD